MYTACEVRINYVGGDDTRDVCSIAQVIFTITDSAGGVVTAYDGDLDLTTDSFTGDWSGTVPGVLDNTINGTGNGEANYAFSGGEGGIVTIDFRNPFIDAELTIAASGTAGEHRSCRKKQRDDVSICEHESLSHLIVRSPIHSA